MTLKTLFLTATMAASATFAKAQVVMNIDATCRGPLTSPYQYGLFFEEINHAGDGGLYAELVRNRSFEEGLSGWEKATTSGATIAISESGLLNTAQKKALDLNITGASADRMRGVKNEGFWGMKIEKGSQYRLSLWARGDNAGFTGNIVARLMKADGRTVIGEATLEGTVETTKWNKLTATITATDTDNGGQLLLLTSNNGHLYIDVVSLFPKTWNDRPNGLRPDLAQLLRDTKPTFLRFPGGCYVEGERSFDDTFQWKRTIGPIEQRPGHMNYNWKYWSSDGLGFDEYLQLCEDLGAAPMFVVNVGLGHGYYIPMEDLDTLVQNTLDAIEYANGDGTTKYGAMRIKNGHLAPYNLKFIEIGNENYNYNMGSNSDQSFEYPERYYKFYKAIKEKYPDIVTIGNVEAWGTDNPSWRNEYPIELVDEHYYRSHSWMRANYNKYDNYSRSISVYNGEYAANAGGTFGTYGNMNSALGEAIYMLGMERNSDVCRMASFAPIFMHESDPCWNYDMIHFNAGSNFVTPSYYVQKLMGNNLGHQNLLWTESGNSIVGAINHMVGVATWDTQASYSNMSVHEGDSGDKILDDNVGITSSTGTWTQSSDRVWSQTANGQPCRAIFDKPFSASSYTYELKARKDGGAEGFLIIFDYQDENNYSWWNIGGWGNTQHAVEVCTNGAKSTVSSAGGSVENGRWYDLKIVVDNGTVTCYIDGRQIHQYKQEQERALYQSVQLTADGKEMILKAVNPHGQEVPLQVNVKNMYITGGSGECLTSANGTDENTMGEPDKVKPTNAAAMGIEKSMHPNSAIFSLPAYSLSIYRIGVDDVAAEVPAKTYADYPEYQKEDEGMAGYLYAHMYETGEHTCYALSQTGRQWTDLLDSKEVFSTKDNTVTGGMRDAYICRFHAGDGENAADKGFLLAGTDMTSRLGWTSNHIMVLMKTPDLVHWTKNVKIDLESPENLKALSKVYPGMDAEKMSAAWAPQIVYDRETKQYVMYYSVGFPDRHRIFYQLIDEDLNILTEPRLYFDPGYDIIDADIVWNVVDQQYVMLYKCERTNGFDRATAKQLVPAAEATGTTVWTVTADFHVGENNQAIEGMSMWRPIGEMQWTLGYINYSSGYRYRFRTMDQHCLGVETSGRDISGSVRAQHGSFVKLTKQEYDFLLDWDKVNKLLPAVRAYNAVKTSEQHVAAIAAAEAALNQPQPTKAEAFETMREARKLLEACPTDTRYIVLEEAIKNGHGDLTVLIDNADFSKGAQGWERTPEFTQANGEVAEFWNTNFMLGQTLTGLPKGKYRVSVQSFYRCGYIGPATAAHDNQTEALNTVLYANENYKLIMSLYDEQVDRYSMNPYTYPDGVGDANKAFNEYGLYTNSLELQIDSGKLNLGLYKINKVEGDWCCFDNFRLEYLGDDSAVRDLTNPSTGTPDGYYNLQGQRVGPGYRGIYIKDRKKIMK